jgi:Fe-S oxidoreductase
MARIPALYNGLMGASVVRQLLERLGGMVDVPLLSRFDFHAAMRRWQVQPATVPTLSALTQTQRERSVVLVQDAFTRYFEAPLLADLVELISRLGYQVYLAPFSANGKPLHVQGFLSAFNRAALRNARQLRELADVGVPLVGLDPAMTLVYRQEYQKVPGMQACPEVALLQEWLLDVMPEQALQGTAESFRLLAHCTEKTNAPAATRQWEQVFERVGLKLTTQATGCCGMSGTYGHEARNRDTSAVIYEQSWARQIDAPAQKGEALATGYSCRSQVKRQSDRAVRHPLQVLLERVRR